MLLGVVAPSDVDANVEEALLLLGTIESANDENARALERVDAIRRRIATATSSAQLA